MLMSPKDDNEPRGKKSKGDSGESEEEEAARLLTEDPMDWMIKNEQVSNMLSVCKSSPHGETLQMFSTTNC